MELMVTENNTRIPPTSSKQTQSEKLQNGAPFMLDPNSRHSKNYICS